MNSFRTRFTLLLVSFMLIIGGGLGLLFYYVFPQFYPNWYGGIVTFFFVWELTVICAVDAGSKKLDSRKLVNLYLLVRVSKLLLGLTFVLTYWLVVKEGVKNFALIFMLFYFLTIWFETYFFSRIEKRIKSKKEE